MQSTAWLEGHLAGEPRILGQVSIEGTVLRHRDDREMTLERLTLLPDLAALRELIKTDDAGAFRPVRGAPTLRRGWRSGPLSPAEQVLWLNTIYPAAIAFAAAREAGILEVTPFVETARRQTGMYRLTQMATPEQIARTIDAVCARGCLRQRLWCADEKKPGAGELPFLCPEACNYFVSKCRETLVEDRKAERL